MESQSWKDGLKKNSMYMIFRFRWMENSVSKDTQGACYDPGWVGMYFREE